MANTIIEQIKQGKEDKRARYPLVPCRIVKVWGCVEGAESLLLQKPEQVTLVSSEKCVLKNIIDGAHAAVLVDFGTELHGSIKMLLLGCRSSNGNCADFLIRTGESAEEAITPLGTDNTTNDHAVRDRTVRIGRLSSFETNETGFRFLYVELLGSDTAAEIKSLIGVLTVRNLDYIGSFECNDERLNKIWKTAAYTVHLCMQEYLWDGIKRDRLVWVGDMHTEINTILSVFGYQDIIENSLDLIRDETPVGSWMNDISVYSVWWLLNQSDVYRATGNISYLKAQRVYLKTLIEKLFACVDENGEERLPPIRLLDWQNKRNEAATHAGFQGLLKMAFDRAAELLDVLGESLLAASCRTCAERMKQYVPDCAGSKQAAAFLALSGLADAKEMNDKWISPNGAVGYTTFLGYYVLAAKAMAGDHVGALNDIRTYWGAMLDLGATSFWEDFDINWTKNAAPISELTSEGKINVHGTYGSHCYVKYRHSLCHGWASGPCPYLSHYVLGVQNLAPNQYKISPHLGNLTWVRGSYPTPYGIIEVDCKRAVDGALAVNIRAPKEIEIIREF